MANIHKLELYIVDANGDLDDKNEIINLIENHQEVSCKIKNYTIKEFEWNDDLEINYSDATIESYEKYFKDGDK